MKKGLLIFGIIIIVITLGLSITISVLNKNLDNLKNLDIKEIDLSNVKDGIYNGSYTAFPINVVVEVTVKKNKITNIDIIKHDTGQGKSAEKIINNVIEEQSLSVDTVTGATYSSIVILKAIEDALIKE